MTEQGKLASIEGKKLKAFTMHGALFHGASGNQAIGDCVFCLKERHFYVNMENLLWDCKVCGNSGNLLKFLDLVNIKNRKNLTERVLRRLVDDRGLPAKAFDKWEIGFHEGQYTFAVRDSGGKIQDLRLFKIGQKVMSTAGVKTGIFGLPEMLSNKSNIVYICEGEWDTIAMQYLLDKAGAEGRAVCSPGASVFKAEWTDFFRQKKVYVCYDNDEAGEKGQEIVGGRLSGLALDVKFLHWPERMTLGYDIRDFVKDIYLELKKPKSALKKLLGYMRNKPKTKEGEVETAGIEIVQETPPIDPTVTVEDAISAYDSKMYLPCRGAIELCMISIISNFFETNPLWYFLVAPPSSGKTEIINGFKFLGAPYDNLAHFTSNLTAHTLISGMKCARDPSLLAQFNNAPKTLFIKDFTPILSGNENEKNDIFGGLRDSYDGYSAKDFGNGVQRRYDNLNFSVISGVTYQIYDEASLSNALGERFGKYILPYMDEKSVQMKMMKKGFNNIGKEQNLDDYTATVVYSAMKNVIARILRDGKKLPAFPEWAQNQVANIAMYTAHMRSGVSRDKFRRDYIKSKPTVEMPMRFSMMIATTAIMRALLYGRPEVNAEDLAMVRKIALDSVNQRDEEILRKIFILNQGKAEPTRRNIQAISSYTPFTVEQVIQDFVMVGVLRVERQDRKLLYKFTDNMDSILSSANIYKTQEELEREAIVRKSLEMEKTRRSGARKKLVFKSKKEK